MLVFFIFELFEILDIVPITRNISQGINNNTNKNIAIIIVPVTITYLPPFNVFSAFGSIKFPINIIITSDNIIVFIVFITITTIYAQLTRL